MFTGIISEIGKVRSLRRKGSTFKLEVLCPKTLAAAGEGDSVSINGVCLTVSEKNDFLSFDVVPNTMETTNLKRLKIGSMVNLENALKIGDDVSGHFVSGHVDGERKIKKNRADASGWVLEIIKSPEDLGLVATKGSVAVDGVSLTVAYDDMKFFRIFLIPYTIKDTILPDKKIGEFVNVEYDMLGKYAGKRPGLGRVTMEKLEGNGFV